jgi:hypothetical protein
LRIFEELSNESGMADVLSATGFLALLRGDTPRAIQDLRAALSIEMSLEDMIGVIPIIERLAACAAASNQAVSAAKLIDAAGTLREELDSPASPLDERVRNETIRKCVNVMGDMQFRATLPEWRTVSAGKAIELALNFRV